MGRTNPTDGITIAELASLVAEALGNDYEGVRSGRVQDVPDARTIRWYQTLGMVDRPAAFRGRTALFSRRHVAQLAAIKTLQASGFKLADIQQGLAGKSDVELARTAGIPLKEFDRLMAASAAARAAAQMARLPAALAVLHAAPRRPGAFWKQRPVDESPATRPAPAASGRQSASSLQSITLGGSTALLWNGRPLTAAEAAAVATLARPLIEYLASRGAGSAAEPAPDTAPSSPRPHTEARP